MIACALRRTALVVFFVGAAAGCGMLDVSDPTAIEEKELNDAAGAELLRSAALRTLSVAVDDGVYWGGLLADEFFFDTPGFYQQYGITSHDEMLDRRDGERYEQLWSDAGGYGQWQAARTSIEAAMPKLRAYAPANAVRAKLGEMFALRGFVTKRLAEDFCPGFPLNDLVDGRLVLGGPLTTEEVFAAALADFDSAAAYAGDSLRILRFAQVGRGSALLQLGRFDEAAAAVADVPTEYVAYAEYMESISIGNHVPSKGTREKTRAVSNGEGGAGLDYVAAHDPRVLLDSLGIARDGVTILYAPAIYPNLNAPIVIGSGIEARLIEAEVALHRDDASWRTILNDLRTMPGGPGLADTADPGTPQARLDLLFRERAFWLFATGHRLADLRRLVRTYGRQAEDVYPSGAYRLGGVYAAATSLPFPETAESQFNPAITGCTAR